VITMEKLCKECFRPFPIVKHHRGRPQVFCSDCKKKHVNALVKKYYDKKHGKIAPNKNEQHEEALPPV
jgi:hypothetical protein